MKLLDSLFHIVSEREGEGCFVYTVELNPQHFIYKAHFPGEPITPGVCIMQMAVELLGKKSGHTLSLECARSIKFLRVISPDEVTVIECSLGKVVEEDGRVKGQVSIGPADSLYARLSLTCRIDD